MPKVGKMRFPYTEQGVKEAQKYSQSTSPEQDELRAMAMSLKTRMQTMERMRREAEKQEIQRLAVLKALQQQRERENQRRNYDPEPPETRGTEVLNYPGSPGRYRGKPIPNSGIEQYFPDGKIKK